MSVRLRLCIEMACFQPLQRLEIQQVLRLSRMRNTLCRWQSRDQNTSDRSLAAALESMDRDRRHHNLRRRGLHPNQFQATTNL